MDELLSMYTQEQLISELGKGHYWYSNGSFYTSAEEAMSKKPTSVENAVYFRFYS